MAYDDIFGGFYEQDALYRAEEEEPKEEPVAVKAGSGIFDNFYESDAKYREMEKPAEERGFGGDVGSHFVRGLNQGAGSVGGMMSELGMDSGEDLYQWTKKNQEDVGLLQPDVSEATGKDGFLYRGFMGAVESTPASLIPFAAGGAAGLINPVLGAAVGTGALFGTFGLGTYHSSKDEAVKFLTETRPDLNLVEIESLATDKAKTDASFEAGTELAGDIAAVLTFGGSKALTQPLKATLKEMLHLRLVPKWYRRLVRVMPQAISG
ncbi:MAG: hypothetical protein JZU65_16110 [Chlorobium sp.]|nr:hypothetical protein [Chlorobium sp.]